MTDFVLAEGGTGRATVYDYPSKPDDYAAFIKREIEKVRTLVRTAGIKND